MKAHKTTQAPPKPVSEAHHPAPSHNALGEELHPAGLLESLKEKQKLLGQLQNEGLIHHDRNMEAELAATIREMDFLFGPRAESRIEPMEAIYVPDIRKDLLAKMPAALRAKPLPFIIGEYQSLRQNLLERRNNYFHALEGPLQADEAMDLLKRMEQIDIALNQIDRNIALARKSVT